jgi:hypothetical protein
MVLKLGVVVHAYIILVLRRLRREDHEFEGCLGYIVSSRPAWST